MGWHFNARMYLLRFKFDAVTHICFTICSVRSWTAFTAKEIVASALASRFVVLVRGK